MAITTPEELSQREFQRSIRGYNTVEVDAYINRVAENYSRLYRENIALGKRLREMEEKLSEMELKLADAKSDDALIRDALVTARKAGDAAIEEAYGRADEILAAVRTGCNAILQSFRDKVEAQKEALARMQTEVAAFKSDLFEKYHRHVELIEQITPVFEYKEDLSPEEYVSHVVSDLKQEVAAQYGISLDSLSAEKGRQTLEMDAVKTEYGMTDEFDAYDSAEDVSDPSITRILEEATVDYTPVSAEGNRS